MAPHSKRSGASDIASEASVFLWARLKLTGIYVFILAVILVGFSGILYQSFQRNIAEADDTEFASRDFHQQFVQDTLARVQQEIEIIDLIILVVAAGVSYVLAGYTLRPIQRSLEAQRIFSENASHELRTPLAVMRNDTEVLLRNPSPTKESIQSTLRSNIEEIDRMSTMAEGLLALARSQNHVLQMEKVDITELTRKIADKMRLQALKKQISLNISAEPLFVYGNAQALERVIMNLLQNGIHHTPPDGSITISIVGEKERALLKMVDTGSGIADRDLPHIFERFYKGEGTTGTGLGLSIVKELVDHHGGDIAIESVKGKGTTVSIRLPLAV
jgi:signal transduction histidine kinase